MITLHNFVYKIKSFNHVKNKYYQRSYPMLNIAVIRNVSLATFEPRSSLRKSDRWIKLFIIFILTVLQKKPCSFLSDYSLLGHVISNITVPDAISCSFECLSNKQCLSYNFKTNICELNDVTKAAAPHDFQRRPGYKYYDTQKVSYSREIVNELEHKNVS